MASYWTKPYRNIWSRQQSGFYWTDEDIGDLRIIDLGESFLQRAEPTRLAQLPALKVPETIFAESFDHRVDLWRAGCVVSCPTHFAEGLY